MTTHPSNAYSDRGLQRNARVKGHRLRRDAGKSSKRRLAIGFQIPLGSQVHPVPYAVPVARTRHRTFMEANRGRAAC